MSTRLNPYISFRDNAREAMSFYQSVFGGDVTTSTFAEFQVSDDPSENDKVMHSELKTLRGLQLMAADTPNRMDFAPGNNISLSLSGAAEDEDELRGYWDKLAVGGTIAEPLEQAPWGASFGMLVDRFGINWMVNIEGAAVGETGQEGDGSSVSQGASTSA